MVSYFYMVPQADVKVLAVYCDDIKVNSAGPGENVKVKLAGISDEEILAGFVLSSVGNCILMIILITFQTPNMNVVFLFCSERLQLSN